MIKEMNEPLTKMKNCTDELKEQIKALRRNVLFRSHEKKWRKSACLNLKI